MGSREDTFELSRGREEGHEDGHEEVREDTKRKKREIEIIITNCVPVSNLVPVSDLIYPGPLRLLPSMGVAGDYPERNGVAKLNLVRFSYDCVVELLRHVKQTDRVVLLAKQFPRRIEPCCHFKPVFTRLLES